MLLIEAVRFEFYPMLWLEHSLDCGKRKEVQGAYQGGLSG
jgi:hypothetical protein